MNDTSNAARLKRHLENVRGDVRHRLLGRGVLRTVALIALAVALALALQAVFGPNRVVGTVALIAVVTIVIASVIRYVVRPLVDFPSLRSFAAEVDRRVLGDDDVAINGLDLGRRRDEEADPLSRSLIDHAIAKSLPPVLDVRAASLDDGPSARPPLAWLTAAGAIVVALAVGMPSSLRLAALSLLHPSAFPYAHDVAIDVTPGDEALESGADVVVYAAVTGSDEPARLAYRKEGGPWKSVAMQTVSSGSATWQGRVGDGDLRVEREVPERRYTARLAELRRDTEYRVVAGDDESDVFALDVLTPPRITAYEIVADVPDYTGLEDFSETTTVGNVSALVGTRVTVRLDIEGEASAVETEWDRGTKMPVSRADDGSFSYSFTVDGPHEYRVRLLDADGRARYQSAVFSIEAIADQPPMVRVIEPGDDVDMPEGMRLPITVAAADDFGLSRVLMHVAKDHGEPFATEIAQYDIPEREAEIAFDWDVSSLDLLPGESATYYFEAFDNDAVSGEKSSRSSVFEIRFPSMAELYQKTEAEVSSDVVGAIEELHEREETLADNLERLRQELERSREGVSWDQRKEVESALQQQESLSESLSDATEALQRSIDRLGENNMSSYQILERMEAIQSLLSEIDNERMESMMDKVREALENMDERALQEAMKNLQLSQEEMLQSLDRSLDHLKQVLAEQKLEAILEELQEVLDEQSDINDLLAQHEDDTSDVEDAGDTDESGEPGDEEADASDGEGDDADGSDADGAESDDGDSESDGSDSESTDTESDGVESEGAESDGSDSEGSDPEGTDAEGAESESAESEGESAEGSESEGAESGESESSESESGGESSESSSESSSGSESESSPSMSPEELAQRQKELAERAEELQKQIEEMQELAKEASPQLDEALQQESPQDMTQEAQQNMEEAGEAMEQQRGESAIRYGLKAEEMLQQAMTGLMSAQQQMQSQQQEMLAEEMLALGADLLHVSDKQEGLLDMPKGESTRTLAAQQMRLYEATGRASEKLNEIGRQTMVVSQSMIRDLGAVLDDMSQATRNYEAGNRTRGGKESETAMTGLNKAVMDLLRLNQQMSASSSSCANPNPMSRIPSMSGMQQQLNQQTKSLQQQMSKGRIPQATGQEALKQLAARQEAIRRGLEEISGELEDRRDVLGRVGELGGELEEIIDKMNRGEVDRELIQRQEKILSRLLAAEKSIRKQDEDNRRMGQAGADVERASPSALSESDLGEPDRMSKDIMQGRTDPFPPRYRRMIEAYFEALGRDAKGSE